MIWFDLDFNFERLVEDIREKSCPFDLLMNDSINDDKFFVLFKESPSSIRFKRKLGYKNHFVPLIILKENKFRVVRLFILPNAFLVLTIFLFLFVFIASQFRIEFFLLVVILGIIQFFLLVSERKVILDLLKK